MKNLYESNSAKIQNENPDQRFENQEWINDDIVFDDPFSHTKGKKPFYKNFSLLKYLGNEIIYEPLNVYEVKNMRKSDDYDTEYIVHGKTVYKNKLFDNIIILNSFSNITTNQYNIIKIKDDKISSYEEIFNLNNINPFRIFMNTYLYLFS